MPIKLYYNYASCLFLMTASGEINILLLQELLIRIFNIKEYKSAKCGMVDFRNARFDFSTEELDTLSNIIMDYRMALPKINWCILTASPHETALAYLFKVQGQHFKSEIEVYSTVQAGLKFHNLSEDTYNNTIRTEPILLLK